MVRSTASRRDQRPRSFLIQKPNGNLSPRVQEVGPEHFGILAVDCAKARSRYLLADFYGQVLVAPTTLPHTAGDFRAAIDGVRQTMRDRSLKDMVVAIERTGDYHRPVQLAFRAAGFETRLVHPFTSKQYRQPADPGNKTDDTDLGGIFRAATQGFGLIEPVWPDLYRSVQMLSRHRRDLVHKTSRLRCQIREALHAVMPGYAEHFCHLFESPAPLVLARRTMSAQAILDLGFNGLARIAEQENLNCRGETFYKILAWARQAPPAQSHTEEWRLILGNREDDRLAKTQQIIELERSLAGLIVRTPYVLLLAIPGINVVTVADLAGELGPMTFYANANNITGRAGLVPSRYQSDQVDRADGPLRRRGNRRLRAVLMQTADNLILKNGHFSVLAERWLRAQKDKRWMRVKVAKSFSRLAHAMVTAGQLFPHPCCQQRHYIIEKLLRFHHEHRTDWPQRQRDLETVTAQLPGRTCAEEARPLQQQLADLANRHRGPQELSSLLPVVLALLQARMVQSNSHEGAGP
jgi:transposase